MSKFWSRGSEGDSSDSSQSSLSSISNPSDNDDKDSTALDDGVNGKDVDKKKYLNNFLAKSALMYTNDPNDPNLIWERIESSQIFVKVPTKSSCYPPSGNKDYTRIVCISDTHSKHRDIPFLPKGDILIHGGDFTKAGEIGTVKDLSCYFGEHTTNFKHIVCIAGNHDLSFQTDYFETSKIFRMPKGLSCTKVRDALENCLYLEDSSATLRVDGVDVPFYGLPWTPEYHDWAFNLPRGEALDKVCSDIPASTDVLITHGPPLGRGDHTDHSGKTGCYNLLQHVQNRIRPRLHVFGHIHQAYGVSYDGHTLFVNASSLNECGRAMNRCIVVDLPHDESMPATFVSPRCQLDTKLKLGQWFRDNNYSTLAKYVDELMGDELSNSLPLGNTLFGENAYMDMCDTLCIHRDKDALVELREAFCKIYAQSYN